MRLSKSLADMPPLHPPRERGGQRGGEPRVRRGPRGGVSLWIIFALALFLRWAAFYLLYFVYKTPGGIHPSPIASEVYDLLARELLSGRGFETWMFAYRPPLAPMFFATVYAVARTGDPLIPTFAQTVVSASVCLLAYALAAELGADERTRKMIALLVAIDPASIAIGLVLAGETLANFFIASSLIFLARLLKGGRLRDAAACGGSMVLAAMARPNAIYFAIVVAVVIVWLAPRWLPKAGLMLAVFALGVLPWYVRNYAYHQLFTFATTGNFNLLFYKAVSVEALATGKPINEIQTELTYELESRLGIATPRDTYDYNAIWRQVVPTSPQADAMMRDMAVEIYLAHPVEYLLTMPIYLVKLLAFTDLYESFGIAKWVEVVFNVLLYGLAALGAFALTRSKQWNWLAAAAAPTVYFIAVPMITGGVQDTRARTNVTVCIALMAARGIGALWSRWHERK